MPDFDHRYKKLKKLYLKQLSDKSQTDFMGYVETYLKFVRDRMILTDLKPKSKDDEVSLAALLTALAEYEHFKACKSDDEQEKKEKAYHWSKFWQLIMLNIEDWKINA